MCQATSIFFELVGTLSELLHMHTCCVPLGLPAGFYLGRILSSGWRGEASAPNSPPSAPNSPPSTPNSPPSAPNSSPSTLKKFQLQCKLPQRSPYLSVKSTLNGRCKMASDITIYNLKTQISPGGPYPQTPLFIMLL